MLLTWHFLMFIGCGLAESDFHAEYADASCQLYSDCELLSSMGYDDNDSCTVEVEAYSSGSCEEYFSEAANECIETLLGSNCDILYSGDGLPDSCASACSEN